MDWSLFMDTQLGTGECDLFCWMELFFMHTQTNTHTPTPPPHNTYFHPQKFINNRHSHRSAPNSPLSLDTTNAVYIITCHLCHLQYIGETGNSIRTRLKQHLYTISKNTLTTHLVSHFQVHDTSHLGICGLESNPGWTPAQRKRTERIWIHKLNTYSPLGLNEL